MKASKVPAAYHGPGWQPRESTLAAEIAVGQHWRTSGVDSEWETLREAVLYLPPRSDRSRPKNADSLQHLEPVDFNLLQAQLQELARILRKAGVLVQALQAKQAVRRQQANLCFVRDLFFMTPEGAIISRMASEVRAGEERWAAKTLACLGVPIVTCIGGSSVFEGADALWISPSLVFIGLGKRTNREGFQQVRQLLRRQGIRCTPISLPPRVQHLLGILQVVDRDLALIREEKLDPKAREQLAEEGFEVVNLRETEEVVQRQAMNFIILGPRCVVMAVGNPRVTETLYKVGIQVWAEVEAGELIKAAGGLACATGILRRDLRTDSCPFS